MNHSLIKELLSIISKDSNKIGYITDEEYGYSTLDPNEIEVISFDFFLGDVMFEINDYISFYSRGIPISENDRIELSKIAHKIKDFFHKNGFEKNIISPAIIDFEFYENTINQKNKEELKEWLLSVIKDGDKQSFSLFGKDGYILAQYFKELKLAKIKKVEQSYISMDTIYDVILKQKISSKTLLEIKKKGFFLI